MTIHSVEQLTRLTTDIAETALAAAAARLNGESPQDCDKRVAELVSSLAAADAEVQTPKLGRLIKVAKLRVTTHATYAEIAANPEICDGDPLSRERVRQLCASVGLGSKVIIKAIRGSNIRANLDWNLDRIMEKEQRPADLAEVASALEVPATTLKANLTARQQERLSAQFAATRIRDNHWAVSKWTDNEVFQCLREAARISGHPSGPLASSSYQTIASSRNFSDGRPWPGSQSVFKRFGSWREAGVRAGLSANTSSGIGVAGRSRYSREDILHAVRSAAMTLGAGAQLSTKQYDAWATGQRNIGSSQCPCLATVRKHQLLSWSALVEEALSH